MKLSEIMGSEVLSVSPEDTAATAWSLMRAQNIRHLVVMKKNQLAGILSERDLGGHSGAAVRENRTVGELMTHRVVTATPSTSLRKAANLMRGSVIGCLPVVEQERVVGIVTETDVLNMLGRGAVRPVPGETKPNLRIPPGSRQVDGIEHRIARSRTHASIAAPKS